MGIQVRVIRNFSSFRESEKLPDDAAQRKVNLLSPIDPKEVKIFFSAQAVLLLEKKPLLVIGEE